MKKILNSLWFFLLGQCVSSILVRLDHPECFVQGSIVWPLAIASVGTLVLLLIHLDSRHKNSVE